MVSTIPDLWPADFGSVALSPVAILREQAELLTRKTEGAVRGQVRPGSGGEGQFIHTFLATVPQLDGYTYELFSVQHGIPFYPVTLATSPTNEGRRTANSHEAFLEALKQVLHSPETVSVIK